MTVANTVRAAQHDLPSYFWGLLLRARAESIVTAAGPSRFLVALEETATGISAELIYSVCYSDGVGKVLHCKSNHAFPLQDPKVAPLLAASRPIDCPYLRA
jgi:hypothetical protein